ncbi:hypothetical protein [Novosphingobium sp. AAP83]|uniref:hypothetical protein n=1 Tax=Novosphingobium sp. AAP83 TaxID=1523425 RepID=UPI000A6C43A9|nr:hypothetical protein [Novosphingobium sp. AAP83]
MSFFEKVLGELYYFPMMMEENRRDRCNINLKMQYFVTQQNKEVVFSGVPISTGGGYEFSDRKQYVHCYVIEERQRTISFKWFNSMKEAFEYRDSINIGSDPNVLRVAGPRKLPYGKDERFGFGGGLF